MRAQAPAKQVLPSVARELVLIYLDDVALVDAVGGEKADRG